MQPVASSSIRAIGYDEDLSELWIAYHNAPDPYVYLNVPADAFTGLEEAGSKGEYVNRMIKPFYPYEQRPWLGGTASAGQAAARLRSAGCQFKEFGDAAGGMVGDAGEHVSEVMLRVEAVELCAFDQRVHCRGTSSACIGAGE